MRDQATVQDVHDMSLANVRAGDDNRILKSALDTLCWVLGHPYCVDLRRSADPPLAGAETSNG